MFLTYIFCLIFAIYTPDGPQYFSDQWEVLPWNIVTRPRLLMDFALRYVRFYPGVNTRAELVSLAPGLCPERSAVDLGKLRFPNGIPVWHHPRHAMHIALRCCEKQMNDARGLFIIMARNHGHSLFYSQTNLHITLKYGSKNGNSNMKWYSDMKLCHISVLTITKSTISE